MSDDNHDRSQSRSESAHRSRPNPFRQSRSLRLSVFITLLGLGLWIYALATAPTQPLPSSSSLVSGLTMLSSGAPKPESRLIDEGSPALFRFGLSFVIGFFLAFILRKVITITLLIAGAIATAVIVLKKANVINLDWDALETQVKHGVDYARSESSNIKQIMLGYAPSSASAVAGLFFGVRHRV